jgi:multicomponent Na+:H+ antiporter subunit D
VLVGAIFVVGALSVAGMPPAAGFVGKLELFRAVADSPALIVLFLVGSALSFVYVFQVYQYDFWREKRDAPARAWPQQVVAASLALVVLALGVYPEPLLALSRDAAAALAGGAG